MAYITGSSSSISKLLIAFYRAGKFPSIIRSESDKKRFSAIIGNDIKINFVINSVEDLVKNINKEELIYSVIDDNSDSEEFDLHITFMRIVSGEVGNY